MRPLRPARPQPAPIRRDPAPSRLRYKLTRIWLRPNVRRLVHIGLPAVALMAGGWTLAAELELKARAEAALAWAHAAVVDRPQFIISSFSIPDVSPELAEQIAEVALVSLPANSLEVNVATVRERVETLDAVERARVRALPSGVLEIRAVERVPVVVSRTAEHLLLLDGNGVRVAEIDSRLRRPDLPLIAGEDAGLHVPEALALLSEAEAIKARIRGLVRVGQRRWDLVLDRDQVIRLPEDEPLTALRRVMAMQAAEAVLDRDLLVVDMRDERRPTLRLTDSATVEIERLLKTVHGEDA